MGCDGRLGSQHGLSVPTNDPGRTVKWRGPGLPVLRSSLLALRRTLPVGDGGKKPVPKEIAYKS